MKRTDGRLLRTASALLAIALAAACGGRDEGRTEREPAAEAGQETSPSRPRQLPDLPAAGTARIEVGGGRVTLVSNAAPRSEALEELAFRAGFELRLGEIEDRPVTVRAEGVPVTEAIAALCEGVSYALGYRVDAERGGHSLVWLQAGVPANIAKLREARERLAERRRRTEQSPERDSESWRERFRGLSATRSEREERIRVMRERVAEAKREQAEHIKRLDSADPAERVEALAEIRLDSEGLEWVTYVAESDEDPAVRRQAVMRLGEEDGFAAVLALVEALEDPAPEVVIEALRGLELNDDPSLLPSIRPLEQHTDPRVQKLAAEVVELLE